MMHSNSTTSFARGKGQPDRDIYNLLAMINQEQLRERHDIGGLYEGRLRSHAVRFDDMKRKWEEFTGVPVPKLLKTSDFIDNELVANATRVNFVPKIQTSVIEEVVEEEEEEQQQQTIIPSTNSMMIPAISSSEQAAFAAPSQTMPPHPDDKIDVDNMVVNDLRKELKKRQLATAGRKAELQDRLREYLAEATLQRETAWASKFAATDVVPAEKVVQTKHVQISDNVDAMDVVMEDEIAGMPMVTNTTSEEIQSVSVVKKEEVMKSEARNPGVSREPVMEPVVATLSSSTLLAAAKKQAPKSALKPSKYHSSVIECAAQLPTTKPASESATKSFVRDASPRPIPTKISNSSTESSTSSSAVPSSAIKATYQLQTSVSKYLNASSSLVHTTPGTTVSRTGGATSATLLQKRQETAAAKEARDAQNRLRTEMRNKASSAIKPPPSHSKFTNTSSLKKLAPNSISSESKQNRPVLAKISETIMAAEKNSSEHVGPAAPHQTIPSQTVESVQSHAPSKPHPTALSNILDPTNKQTTSPKKVPEKQLSPFQSYVMSDREDSDSDSESDEEDEPQRPKKSIPEWAERKNLLAALEEQYADGPNRLDPDKIFGEVLTCNLEEIFDKKKSRYQRRTSSGNWTKDHVTFHEKLTYKRTMGYEKK